MARIKGLFIDTRRGLLPFDPTRMPPNLGRAGYEDIPESPLPAMAFDGQNIMPTPYGYKSAFAVSKNWRYYSGWATDPMTSSIEARLSMTLFQDILSFVTSNNQLLQIGLTEGNLFIHSQSSNYLITDTPWKDHNWRPIQSVPVMEGVKYLWSWCMMDNQLFIYHQGDTEFYVVAGYADFLDAKAAGARVIWDDPLFQFGVVAKTPTFLNMEGQVGIFRADNRLGFWDTDGSVAWSSAINKADFKPDVTTFAGITQFTSVTGDIILIKGHGRGFVIYAKSSITLVTPTTSQERWTSRSIMNNCGIQHTTQVALGADDSTHYCWTTSGMYVIVDGAPKLFEPEFYDAYSRKAVTTMLKMTGNRFLAVAIANRARESKADRYARVVYDGAGNPLTLRPLEPGRPVDLPFPDSWIRDWAGENPEPDLEDFLPIEGIDLPIGEAVPYQPCYTGYRYVNPLEGYTLQWDPSSEEELDTSSWPEWESVRFREEKSEVYLGGHKSPTLMYKFHTARLRTKVLPNTQWMSYEAGPLISPPEAKFIDKAGDEFWSIFQDSVSKLHETVTQTQQFLTQGQIGWEWQNEPTDMLILSPGLSEPLNLIRMCPAELSELGGIVPYRWDTNSPTGSPYGEGPVPYVYIRPEPPVRTVEEAKQTPSLVPTSVSVTVPNLMTGYACKLMDDGCSFQLVATIADVELGYGMEVYWVGEQEPPMDGPTYYEYANTMQNPGKVLYNKTWPCAGYDAGGVPSYFTDATRYTIRQMPNTGDIELGASYYSRGSWRIKPGTEREVVVFQGELSGWGVHRFGSFTKTHTRSIFRPCEPKVKPPKIWDYGDILDKLSNYDRSGYYTLGAQTPTVEQTSGGGDSTEPEGAKYEPSNPGFPPSNPSYANLGAGVFDPYYPTYTKTFIFDLVLEKWGILSYPHALVYNIQPCNMASLVGEGEHYMSSQTARGYSMGMVAAWYVGSPTQNPWPGFTPDDTPAGWPYVLGGANRHSSITFGKIGVQRAGETFVSGVGATIRDESRDYVGGYSYSGEGGPVKLTITASRNNMGTELYPTASTWQTSYSGTRLEIPLRMTGRWFTIKIEGGFDLSSLQLYAKPTGRVRFPMPPDNAEN